MVQKGHSESNRATYHHGDLRAALIGAALELIDRHGMKGFSLKDAAAAAGVSVAAPYRHFADKDALLGAIQTEGFELFNAALKSAYESCDAPADRIVELGVAYVGFALRQPAHFRVMFSLGGGSRQEPAESQADGFLLLVRAVDGLHPDADEEQRRNMVVASWSVVHGYAVLQLDGALSATIPGEDWDTQLRRVLRWMTAKSI